MKAIETLEQELSERIVVIQSMKRNGKKIVGFLPGDFISEELIYASGAVPICLVYGGTPEPVEMASYAAARILCPFSKTPIGLYALKQPYYRLLDLIVVPISCNHMRRVADMWHHFTDTEVFYFGVPRELDSIHSFNYYLETLKIFKNRLEKLCGQKIDDNRLKEAVHIYNNIRDYLRTLSLCRKNLLPSIAGSEFIRLNHLSYLCDAKTVESALSVGMVELNDNDKRDRSRARLMLAGPNIAMGDTKLISIIERLGASIVVEEICEGIRFYWENIVVDGDILHNIVHRYITKRVPGAFQGGSTQKRISFLKKLAAEFKIDGIIWYGLRYCESYNLEVFYVEKIFADLNIPILKIESEYNTSDVGQINTRVEAFLEMLEGRSSNV